MLIVLRQVIPDECRKGFLGVVKVVKHAPVSGFSEQTTTKLKVLSFQNRSEYLDFSCAKFHQVVKRQL